MQSGGLEVVVTVGKQEMHHPPMVIIIKVFICRGDYLLIQQVIFMLLIFTIIVYANGAALAMRLDGLVVAARDGKLELHHLLMELIINRFGVPFVYLLILQVNLYR